MYRFYSVTEETLSACSSAGANNSDQPFSFKPKRRPASVHQDLINSSATESSSLSMIASSPPGIHLPVPVTTNSHNGNPNFNDALQSHSPIFGVRIGVLLGQPLTPNSMNNGNGYGYGEHRRSIFTRQKSEEADRKRRLTMPLVYRMYESQSEKCGTVRGPDEDNFRPEEASKKLREALAGGIQSHDQTLIDILLMHNNFQRQKIANTYECSYGRILADDIDEEAGGYFAESIQALLTPQHIFSSKMLWFAISGKSFGRSVAVELGLTTSVSQLRVIRDTYQTEFRTSLERDLSMKVEGLFGKILSQLLLRKEDFSKEVFEEDVAKEEAEALLKGGSVEELGRSLELFNRIFGLHSTSFIRKFVQYYDQKSKEEALKDGIVIDGGGGGLVRGRESRSKSRERTKDFETNIRKSVNIHSDVKQAILLYVRISKNMQLYFAEQIHEAISQNRPDHSSIIRILISRSEIDLYDICNEYKKRYGHYLIFDLQNTCSGDFLRLISQLVNPSDMASGDEVFS